MRDKERLHGSVSIVDFLLPSIRRSSPLFALSGSIMLGFSTSSFVCKLLSILKKEKNMVLCVLNK